MVGASAALLRLLGSWLPRGRTGPRRAPGRLLWIGWPSRCAPVGQLLFRHWRRVCRCLSGHQLRSGPVGSFFILHDRTFRVAPRFRALVVAASSAGIAVGELSWRILPRLGCAAGLLRGVAASR